MALCKKLKNACFYRYKQHTFNAFKTAEELTIFAYFFIRPYKQINCNHSHNPFNIIVAREKSLFLSVIINYSPVFNKNCNWR